MGPGLLQCGLATAVLQERKLFLWPDQGPQHSVSMYTIHSNQFLPIQPGCSGCCWWCSSCCCWLLVAVAAVVVVVSVVPPSWFITLHLSSSSHAARQWGPARARLLSPQPQQQQQQQCSGASVITITEKAPARAFFYLKALVGAFSVIVQLHRLIVHSTSVKYLFKNLRNMMRRLRGT